MSLIIIIIESNVNTFYYPNYDTTDKSYLSEKMNYLSICFAPTELISATTRYWHALNAFHDFCIDIHFSTEQVEIATKDLMNFRSSEYL